MAKKKTQLDWYPTDVDEWDLLCEGLDPAEEGVLARAFRRAWKQQGTLDDTPEAWEELLGERVDEFEPFVRRYFKPSREFPGRLVWPKNRRLWETQFDKYQGRVGAGEKGGRAQTAPGKRRGRPSTVELSPQLPIEPHAENSNAISEVVDERPDENSIAISAGSEDAGKKQCSTDLRQEFSGPNGPERTPGGDAPLAAAEGRGAPPRDRECALRAHHDRRRHVDDAPDTLPAELPPSVSLTQLFGAEIGEWPRGSPKARASPARTRSPKSPNAPPSSTAPPPRSANSAHSAKKPDRARDRTRNRAARRGPRGAPPGA